MIRGIWPPNMLLKFQDTVTQVSMDLHNSFFPAVPTEHSPKRTGCVPHQGLAVFLTNFADSDSDPLTFHAFD